MSSNDTGEEPRAKPPAQPRPRASRPASTTQRVKDLPATELDPREEVLSKRPQPGPRPANSRRPSSAGGVPRAKPARNGTAATGSDLDGADLDGASSNGANSNGATANGASSNGATANGAAANGRPAAIGTTAKGRPTANGTTAKGRPSANGGRGNGDAHESSPVTSPIPVTPPLTEPPVALAPAPTPTPAPAHGPLVGPATRIDPGMMPAPAALAPQRVPHVTPLPALFDDDAHVSGPIAFDRLFDTGQDPSGPIGIAPGPPRQRSMQFTQTGRRGRPRVRRVTRVVRHVDPWSVFKVALCFSLVLYGVCLTAGVLLWNVAYTTGTIDNVQRFFESFGWDTFRFKGGELFHNAWIAGLFASLGLTGLIVLTATLFNLITDLVGGIRVTVLEEEVVERHPVVRGPLLRRRTRPITGIVTDASRREGYPDDGDSLDSPLPFG